MWQFIVASTESKDRTGEPGKAVSTVLTTHSMEECEALCNRIAILHQGKLLCLGSPSQLKSTYSSGFILEVKILYASSCFCVATSSTRKEGCNSACLSTGHSCCWRGPHRYVNYLHFTLASPVRNRILSISGAK